MPLDWEERKRLLRMHGIADELLTSARGGAAGPASDAIGREIDAIVQEVHLLLLDTEEPIADEFERIVLRGASDSPADVRAAVLVGWLKAGLAADTFEAQTRAEERQKIAKAPVGRKQSIGFKIRSPVTRDTAPEADSKEQ